MTLDLTDVSLTLGDGADEVRALDHVDLHVAAGEVIAVVGPSGSGKSSLLAVAGAMLTPTSGTILVDGVDLGAIDDAARTRLRRERVGFVFQGVNLLPSLTALEQLLLLPHLDGVRPATQRQRAAELLERVGMAHKADRRPHELSGGERQRVGIARALMVRPAVVLADEPTSALDQARSAEIAALLADQAHADGVATVVVTHDPSILDHMDRVLTMADGVLTERTPATIR
ncbi:MAG: ABC transporter ATP-binding protein [Acidimicrobiales bacterium]|nr:ABC transporter ATP-binding protein [Acidimicrobiales bacterium]MCB1260775.1 ABC transporter ATP-binding protein [Acidimicrobiales bacterium]